MKNLIPDDPDYNLRTPKHKTAMLTIKIKQRVLPTL